MHGSVLHMAFYSSLACAAQHLSILRRTSASDWQQVFHFLIGCGELCAASCRGSWRHRTVTAVRRYLSGACLPALHIFMAAGLLPSHPTVPDVSCCLHIP